MKVLAYAAAVAATGVLFLSLSALPAQAQRPRNFVSGVGSDTNPCTRTEPCKTLAQAISVTEAGGEVIVLDSAEYGPGPITIGQAITITAPDGVDAQITSNSGNAITITATSGIVVLTGLNLVGAGGTTGVAINSANIGVSFFNGSIVGFTTTGIGGTVGSSSLLWIQNSLISNDGSSNETGIAADGPTTVRNVALVGCKIGIQANGLSSISDSFLFDDGTGIQNGPGIAVVISNDLIELNATGVIVNSTDDGAVHTTGDNVFYGNGTDVSGSLTTLAKK